MDKINRIWELGSWRREVKLEQSTDVDRKDRCQLKEWGAEKQRQSPSRLWDEVAHRKALFDRIGGHGDQT